MGKSGRKSGPSRIFKNAIIMRITIIRIYSRKSVHIILSCRIICYKNKRLKKTFRVLFRTGNISRRKKYKIITGRHSRDRNLQVIIFVLRSEEGSSYTLTELQSKRAIIKLGNLLQRIANRTIRNSRNLRCAGKGHIQIPFFSKSPGNKLRSRPSNGS